MDEIIKIINESHKDVIVTYSSFAEYFNEVTKQNVEWPRFESDFFPYLTDMNEYWSGFYTTDCPFKKRVRDYSSYVRATA